MPTKKIASLPNQPCISRYHYPPIHHAFTPGLWEHTCPMCGEKQAFRVEATTLVAALAAMKWPAERKA